MSNRRQRRADQRAEAKSTKAISVAGNKREPTDFEKVQMMRAFSRIPVIINNGIFNFENRENPLLQSATTELLVMLRDLMAKADIFANRIDFTDDVNITDTVKDITDAVKYVRDCCCHLETKKHFLDETKQVGLTFLFFYTKNFGPVINGVKICSDYDDEFMVAMGNQKLYMKRHILRAYEEAKIQLMPLLQEPQ